MRGRAEHSARHPIQNNSIRRRGPSSVGCAATFSREGRRPSLCQIQFIVFVEN